MERKDLLLQAGAEAWAIWPVALNIMLANPEPIRLEIDSEPQIIGNVGEVQAIAKPGPKVGRVARISIMGPISRRASVWTMIFGGTSVDGLIKTLRDVAADDTIGTVLLDVDSPGGTVGGLTELAAEVRKLRESKHVVALANTLMASAAYWIASQADEIVATPEALIGSIGVFTVHEDWSQALEMAGIKTTYIAAGKYKTEANPDQPLSDEARAHIQGIVDESYRLFVNDVARGRGVSAADVRGNYGEGRVLTAPDAKAAGLIDRIAGFDETVRRLAGTRQAETDPVSSPNASVGDPQEDGGNSLALIELQRRRLEIAQIKYMEDGQ